MCFHNSLSVESQKLENRYQAEFISGHVFKPVYHAAAFQYPEWPVITNELPNKIQMFQWGLIPQFTKSFAAGQEIRKLTINARVETLLAKRSFVSSAKHRRCIIPSTGFFEWQHIGKIKIPWFVRHADKQIFSIAGIWDTWVNIDNGSAISTFSIVTTEARDIMEKIHNTKKRMPLVLCKNDEEKWLTEGAEQFVKNITGYKGEQNFIAHTISPLLSAKGNSKNSPDIQKEYPYVINGELF
jgi:putative SOS response-associated peptidase YedK